MRFIDDFFATIEDPDEISKKLADRCLS